VSYIFIHVGAVGRLSAMYARVCVYIRQHSKTKTTTGRIIAKLGRLIAHVKSRLPVLFEVKRSKLSRPAWVCTLLGASPLVRAARCDNATRERPLSFAAVYFFSSARDIRGLGRSPRNFATWSEMGVILKTRSKNWGSSPKKWGRKTCFFGAISDDFALRSRISQEWNKISTIGNGVANYDLSRVC